MVHWTDNESQKRREWRDVVVCSDYRILLSNRFPPLKDIVPHEGTTDYERDIEVEGGRYGQYINTTPSYP